MEEKQLGPNGALLYCMEQLDAGFEWLEKKLIELGPDAYFFFDCPGQVELFTCHDAFKRILTRITKLHFRLATIHLIDSFNITDAAKFISAIMLSMQSMLRLECPHLNVLTKIDNLQNYSELRKLYSKRVILLILVAYELEDYCEPTDLTFLTRLLDQTPFGQKHRILSEALCGLIEDVGLVSFIPFAVEDKDSMAYLLGEVDKANGHVFGSLTAGNESIAEAAFSSAGNHAYMSLMQSRYIIRRDHEDSIDAVEPE